MSLLENMSYKDQLTKLGNRFAMEKYINEIDAEKSIGVVYCDITGLKRVNDSMGHEAGDQLILRACDSLKKAFGEYGLFRIGGDEFSLIIEEGNINDEFCEMMVRRIKRVIDRPFNIEGRLLSVDTSCGYAIYPEHSQKIDEIRIMADHRMYEDKTQNRKKG